MLSTRDGQRDLAHRRRGGFAERRDEMLVELRAEYVESALTHHAERLTRCDGERLDEDAHGHQAVRIDEVRDRLALAAQRAEALGDLREAWRKPRDDPPGVVRDRVAGGTL